MAMDDKELFIDNAAFAVKRAMLGAHTGDFSDNSIGDLIDEFIAAIREQPELENLKEIIRRSDVKELIETFHKYVKEYLGSLSEIYRKYGYKIDKKTGINYTLYNANRMRIRDKFLFDKDDHGFRTLAIKSIAEPLYNHLQYRKRVLKKNVKVGRSKLEKERVDALVDWVMDIPNMSENRALGIFDVMKRKGIELPDPEIMKVVGKWASTAEDNTEVLRKSPAIKKKIAKYTNDNKLYFTDDGTDVRKKQIYRAINLPTVMFKIIPDVISGKDSFKIRRQIAESWTLDFGAAMKFCGTTGGKGCLILRQPSLSSGSLIWNFMNKYMGYEAFNSGFRQEKELILESQCDRCNFKEISAILLEFAAVSISRKIMTAILKAGYRLSTTKGSVFKPKDIDDSKFKRLASTKYTSLEFIFDHKGRRAQVELYE